MRILGPLLASCLLALELALLAILAIHNVTPVTLHFLMFSSIKIPVGVLLVFCVALGLVLGTLLLTWMSPRPGPAPRMDDEELEF
jgi:uncharacterized integral membrane protein